MRSAWPVALGLGLGLGLAAGCGGTLDAGSNHPHGLLPVDERNPVLLLNDTAADNWMGEYALLLADTGGPRVVGLVVCATEYSPDLEDNVVGFTKLLNAARASGFRDVPELTASAATPLSQPDDGKIDSTKPNHSTGAQRILDLSLQFSLPNRPLVIVTGTQLTDIADAYLVDPSVVDRVVVVASLGSWKNDKASMAVPNGELDPWADWIVAHRYKYVQVSAFYDQAADVPTSKLASLPRNAFGDFMRAKQPGLSGFETAVDQVAILSASVPGFVAAVERTAPDPAARFGSPSGQGPPLVPQDDGNAWVVTAINAKVAGTTLWHMLKASANTP